MIRFSLWTATVFAMIASTSVLACPGGMGGGQHGGKGMGMHAMMHGHGQGMSHGQMGQGCGKGGEQGGMCMKSGAAAQSPSGAASHTHAAPEPARQ